MKIAIPTDELVEHLDNVSYVYDLPKCRVAARRLEQLQVAVDAYVTWKSAGFLTRNQLSGQVESLFKLATDKNRKVNEPA